MEIVNQIKLDMIDGGYPPQINVVEGEFGVRIIEAKIYSAGSEVDLSDCVPSIAYKKPDGKKGWYDKLPDGSKACKVFGNVICAKLTQQMLNVPGVVSAVIRIENISGNQRAITFPFVVNVYDDPGSNVEKSEDYYAVQNWDDVNSAIEELREAIESGGGGGNAINDSVISKDYSWSSKNTVDKLCPTFETTGTRVVCEPLEGYPVEVVSNILLDYDGNAPDNLTIIQQTDRTEAFSVDFASVSTGIPKTYNWNTGLLVTDDEVWWQYDPETNTFTEIDDRTNYTPITILTINAKAGENIFLGGSSTLTVKGRLDPNKHWAEKLAEQEAIIAEQEAELAKLNKQYELIEDIALDADVTGFEREMDTNGVAYDFSGILVRIDFEAATASASVVVYARTAENKNIVYYGGANDTVSTTKRVTVVRAYNDHGLSCFEGISSTTNNGGNAVNVRSAPSYNGNLWKNVAIIGVSTYASSGTVKIPAGTRIRIYAVRG